MTAIVAFVLFIVFQYAAGIAAFLLSGLPMPKTEAEVANLQHQLPATLQGECLFVAECILAVGLAIWFVYRRRKAADKLAQGYAVPANRREPYVETTRPIRWWHYLLAIVGLVALGEGVSGIASYFGATSEEDMKIFHEMLSSPLCILTICLTGPIVEELVFREGIITSILRFRCPAWIAVLISAALFGYIHGNLTQGIPAFVVGIPLGLLYLRTMSLRLTIPAHVVNNSLAVLLMAFPVFDDMDMPMALAIVLVVLGAGLLTLVLKK